VVSTLLRKLLADTDVQFSESFEFDGQEMFKHACGVGLEGVASKVRDSRYQSGRSNDWARKICAPRAPDAANLRFCAEGKFDGIYLGSPSITT
jgi:bifunctional non-homologous end joining protein LigD